MPDFDKFERTLHRLYRPAYRLLCAGANTKEVATKLRTAVRKDRKQDLLCPERDQIIKALSEAHEDRTQYFQLFQDQQSERIYNDRCFSEMLEEIHSASSNYRSVGLAIRVAKSIYEELRLHPQLRKGGISRRFEHCFVEAILDNRLFSILRDKQLFEQKWTDQQIQNYRRVLLEAFWEISLKGKKSPKSQQPLQLKLSTLELLNQNLTVLG